jgi:hypothetical protein
MIEDLGDHIRIVGAYVTSRQHVDEILSKETFASLSIAVIESDFGADPRMVFLGLEAKRYRFASLYDPLLAVNIPKIDLLPLQDRMIVKNEIEFGKHDYIMPKLLSQCDGIKSIEEICKKECLCENAVLFLMNIFYRDGVLDITEDSRLS